MSFSEYPISFSAEQQLESIRKGISGVFETVLTAAGWANMDVFGWEHTVSGGSITVNTATFKSAVSNAVCTKIFTYVSAQASWQLAAANVSLSTYGIVLTGTPANGNTITVEYAVRKAQTLTINGLLESSDYTTEIKFSSNELPSKQDKYMENMSKILRFQYVDNSITYICTGDEIPDTDIPIQIWEA
jgi:hypothetical protein